MAITLRDTVRWKSQAGGSTREKEGLVEEVVPAGQVPNRQRFPQLYRSSGVGMPRNHESYVVRVKGRGLYWPRAASLVKVKGGCGSLDASKLTVYSLGKSPTGDVVIVSGSVGLVDAISVTDGDFSRETALAEKSLRDMGYTVYGSFLHSDKAASLVELAACQHVFDVGFQAGA